MLTWPASMAASKASVQAGRQGATPGTALEVTADETGVRIERVAPGPKLVRIGKRLVARPTAGSEGRPDVDVAALIEEERNRWP